MAKLKQRVQVAAPGDDNPANIWAFVTQQDGKLLVSSLHQHADLKPQVGWTVTLQGKPLSIVAVEPNGWLCEGGES